MVQTLWHKRFAIKLLIIRISEQQSRVFFDVSFAVYTHVDNRDKARASD